jgi:Tfp pilus assembly protein FimT
MKQLLGLAVVIVVIDALAITAVPAFASWLDRSGIQKLPPKYDHGRPI